MIKVLITNDDGIDAQGIKVLAEALMPLADVYVVAPAEEQSGKSQSITFLQPVKVEKRDMKGAVAAYAAWGTPADCVKIGLCILEKEGIKPDYVISGINLGYNTGLAAYYSGTVAAAREGALNGIKSIALSLGSHEATEFDSILGMLPVLLEMADKMSPGTLLSVNAPNIPASEIKGYRIAEAAPFGYGIKFIFEEVEDGLYQMDGEPAEMWGSTEYDMDVTEDGYVAVSPIPTTLADRVSLSRLRDAYAKDEVLAVIVDAQEDVLDDIPGKAELEGRLAQFAHAAARMDLPLLLTERYSKGAFSEEVMKYASRFETAERMKTDAWTSEDMVSLTSLVDARKVIIGGAETHLALFQTTVGFLERGYEVIVIEDCTGSAHPDIHKKAIRELKEAGAKIAGLERTLMELASKKEPYIRDSVERILR